jgi:hypothetical protein
MRARLALLGVIALLTTLGWTGETWAQTKVARGDVSPRTVL